MMEDSLSTTKNYLVISEAFLIGKEDFNVLMKKIENGSNIMVSSFRFNPIMEDTLGFKVNDDIINELYPEGLIPTEDSLFLKLTNPNFKEKFIYRRMDAPYNFDLDTLNHWEVLMVNEENKPVAIARSFGSGRLILNCIPLVFSNYYMLYSNSYKASAALLSQLPESALMWTEFYSRGRGEPQTPFKIYTQNSSSTLGLLHDHFLGFRICDF